MFAFRTAKQAIPFSREFAHVGHSQQMPPCSEELSPAAHPGLRGASCNQQEEVEFHYQTLSLKNPLKIRDVKRNR